MISGALVAIVFCHGSPGVPSEFRLVEAQLRKSGWQGKLYSYDRFGKGPRLAIPPGALYIGYSWGSAYCLKDAVADEGVKQVLLISPYLFPQPMSLFRKIALGLPWVGDWILSKSAPKAVEEFLRNSCSPQGVPAPVWEERKTYSDPRRLKRALFEKEESGLSGLHSLKELRRRDVRFALLWGRKDLTSGEEVQIRPVREAAQPVLEKALDDGGHALIWTHPEAVASVITEFMKKEKL